MRIAICLLAAVLGGGSVGCGGTKGETKPNGKAQPEEEANHPTSQGGLTPELVDSIDAVFRRKVGSLNQCWQDEHLKSGDRTVQGEVTIGLKIEKSGTPSNVKILKSTINNVAIETCVQKEVTGWHFPELPTSYPYSRSVHLGAQY